MYRLLFDQYFYKTFDETANIVDVIIKSIAKTDFSSWSYSKRYSDELSVLGTLLNQSNLRFNNMNFYTMNVNGKIKDALINKCAEIFSKPEAKNINLYDFMAKEPYKNIYFFISDYLKEEKNKNGPACQNLIVALKTWAKNNNEFIDYASIEKLINAFYTNYRYRQTYFFSRDKEFNQIIAGHCNNAIENHLKTIGDACNRMTEYLSIKSSVENFFSVKLNIEIDFNN